MLIDCHFVTHLCLFHPSVRSNKAANGSLLKRFWVGITRIILYHNDIKIQRETKYIPFFAIN